MTAKKSQRKRAAPVKKHSIFESKTVKIGIIVIFIAIVVIAAVYLILGSSNEDNEVVENPIAVFDTTMGTFKVKLFAEKVPITVDNFVTHANNGYYDGVIFHRVIKDFMIQGGDPNGDGTGGYAAKYHEGYGDKNNQETWVIPDEFDEDLSNVRGTISMANRGSNTGGSQFFINVVDNSYLDFNKEPLQNKHAVFGEVIEGMDVVDAISEVKTTNDKPDADVVINSITIIYEE